jgi:hypothetical protein
MRRLLSYEENDPVAFSCILFALVDGVVISCDAICLRKVGHRYLAEVPHSFGSTQDVVGKEIVVGSTPEGIWPGPETSDCGQRHRIYFPFLKESKRFEPTQLEVFGQAEYLQLSHKRRNHRPKLL